MTTLAEQYDAIVVGAGPAGSTTAAGIAKGGFRVLLIEEHAQVGVPLHCSGLVTPRTLDEAGVGNGLVINEVVGARIYAPSGRSLILGDGKTRAYVIDRVGLDRALVEKAQDQGVELQMGTRLTGASSNACGVSVQATRNGKSYSLKARLLVGADGAHSRVARVMGMSVAMERVFSLGAEGLLPGVDSENAQVFVGTSVAPGWFAWVIPLGDGRVRVGVGSSDGHMRPVAALRNVFQTYAAQLQGWQPTRWVGGVLPIWSRRTIVRDNVMLVGDAAGQVKPTSGGGIYPSLVGARLAAEAACAALANDDLSAQALGRYARAWDKTLGREFRRGEDLRRVYKTMTDKDFDRLLRIFGNKRLLKLINRYGDIDYPGGLFQRLTRFAPALWLFVHGPLRYARLWG